LEQCINSHISRTVTPTHFFRARLSATLSTTSLTVS
jgi:hypothetical protein